MSRSNFPFAGGVAGACAQATQTPRTSVQTIPHSTPRASQRCMYPSSVNGRHQAYWTSLTYSRCVKKPVITPGNVYSATYLGFTAASANSQNMGISENSVNL